MRSILHLFVVFVVQCQVQWAVTGRRMRLEALHVAKVHKESRTVVSIERHRQLQLPVHNDSRLYAPDQLEHVPDFAVPSRNRTILLMRLCLAAYPTCSSQIEHLGKVTCAYRSETMEDIFKAHLSVFGPNVTSQLEEERAMEELETQNWNLLMGDDSDVSPRYQVLQIPQDSAEFSFGVHALEWIDTVSNTTILAFRGTLTHGDYANIENWITDFILEKSTERMKYAWQHDANLEWTEEMQQRAEETKNDSEERLTIRLGESYILGQDRPFKDDVLGRGVTKQSFPSELAGAVANNSNLSEAIGGLTELEAEATGYWKITQYIVDQVATRAEATNSTLVLTGHSQGGTRAQLAAMYLERQGLLTPPTITFAATGSACVSRLLFNDNANLLDTIDPFTQHDNLIDYSHPLDPWGNAMLGIDNGGSVCFWGNAMLSQQSLTDGSYRYCSQIYGYSGPTLIANEAGVLWDFEGDGQEATDLEDNFLRCRYFTHSAETILLALLREDILMENGTTDGGCRQIPAIPKDDLDEFCPTGRLSGGEKKLVLEISAGVITCVVLFLLGLCCCCRRCCRCLECPQQDFAHSPVIQTDDDDVEIELPEIE